MTGTAEQGEEAELAPPNARKRGFIEEGPGEKDQCAPGEKKTRPKKTAFSNRAI